MFDFIYEPLRDLALYLWRRKHRVTPEQKIQLKAKWKAVVEEQLAERRRQGLNEDVIVRDVKRAEHYPEGLPGRGISPWFRAGLVGTYHDGILVGLSWARVVFDEKLKKWVFARPGEEGKTVAVIGYVPYHRIESIDWDGDEYYGFPHLYLHFDGPKKQPYERIGLCEKNALNGRAYYTEVADYAEVRSLSKKLGIKRIA